MMPRHLFVLSCLSMLCSSACGVDDPPPPEEGEELSFSGDDEDGEEYVGLESVGKGDVPDGFGGPIEFENACEPGDDVLIAAVGDLLLHGRLQQQAYAAENGAISLWEGVEDLLEQADLTYVNLEGPTAPGVNASGRDVRDPGKRFDGVVYTSYPMFNYHPSVLDDLMASGVDLVSTANNHSLDRRSLGADRTIDELEARGLPYTGTRRSDSDSEEWWTIVEAAGFRLAFLACTYGTNGIPDNDDQVLWCYQDAEAIDGMIRQLASRSDVDAVIMTPHWGQEYTALPEDRQFDYAHRWLDAGALAVIGNHPHVIQPWERYVTADGRETFAMYSIGNFVSGQRHLPRRTTIILYLALYRGADGATRVRGARYVPLHMTEGGGRLTLESVDRAGAYHDSRDHVISLMGASNLQLPWEEVVTNPQCDPDWVPPHPHDGWVGGACESDLACGGVTSCDTDLPGGFCTLGCERTCPDLAGRPTTFCVDLGDGAGSCVLTCEDSTECREGYVCVEQSRYMEPQTARNVCVPL